MFPKVVCTGGPLRRSSDQIRASSSCAPAGPITGEASSMKFALELCIGQRLPRIALAIGLKVVEPSAVAHLGEAEGGEGRRSGLGLPHGFESMLIAKSIPKRTLQSFVMLRQTM